MHQPLPLATRKRRNARSSKPSAVTPRTKPKQAKDRRVGAQNAFLHRLLTPPPFFPPVEIPAHLMQRVKDCGRRERLVLWWLTYKLPAERPVNDAALADAAAVARWDVTKIVGIRDAFPVHWGRMLLKRELRLAHFRKHGSVPDGVTPGWPLGRNVSQIGPKLKRKQDALARRPRKMIKWLGACLRYR
jgi:hypothetical protein